MSNYVLTPNMSLAVPTIGVDPGPDYATNLNNDLNILDGHDHSPGYGVQITPSGLNINSNLPINGNNITLLGSAQFQAVLSSPSNSSIFEIGVDLYYTDGNGNVIRITESGGVAGSPGTIAGLVSPASATYVSGDQTFVWQSNASIAANMDFASAIFRNITPNSTFGVTLSPQAALTSNYTLTLPSLPSVTEVMVLAANGSIGTQTYDQVGEGMTSVGANSIGESMTSPGANAIGITQTRPTQTPNSSLGGVAYSSSSGNFTTSSGSPDPVISCILPVSGGKPVAISLISDTSGGGGAITSVGGGAIIRIQFASGATFQDLAIYNLGASTFPSSSIQTFYLTPSNATYTFRITAQTNGGSSVAVTNSVLVVYEL